tara:strand:- start:8654 stop:10822 length:2169 start_codon:yes stop_codon:yes gene_type:complete
MKFNFTSYGIFYISILIFFGGCFSANSSSLDKKNEPENPITKMKSNPFFYKSKLYMSYPPFDKIKNYHYEPAFRKGMVEQIEEIELIANSNEIPSFENTIVALEKSGQMLERVSRVFFALVSAHTNDSLETIRSNLAPKLSAHEDQILLNKKLFNRIELLYQQKNQYDLNPESLRLVEEMYKRFVRAGAKLSDVDKERLKGINSELAIHQTTFSQNVLKEVNDLAVIIESKDELEGLPEVIIESAMKEAELRKINGKYVITLQNTSGQPPLSLLKNRKLRERIYKASLSRGSRGGKFDNKETFISIIKLRAERAQLMGYANHASYVLENQTAQTTDAVNKRLADLAPAAVKNAMREAKDLQRMIDLEKNTFQLAAWDWDFYSEKVRKDRFEFDESQLKPYFELDNVLLQGVFYAATKLYGITFEEKTDLPIYHPDVRVFEVFDADGSTLSIFIFDPYARSSKRGGAWMNAYVSQSHLLDQKPVIANHLNLIKPPQGEPTLLTFDEVVTAFHEFGHALHGMFSNVNYPSFSGTSVPRDFVEYPSQVNEMWADWPEILKNYAIHYKTEQPMPKELLNKVLDAKKFNQGFATTEYLAASLLDQSWHQLNPDDVPDGNNLLKFENAALESAGVSLSIIPPRYRSTYFSHIMGGYSAGYYSYIWSEVLDADTVEWFKENGGLKRENGDYFRKTLLSRGGSEKAIILFKTFRGSDPNIEPLLERRGLN